MSDLAGIKEGKMGWGSFSLFSTTRASKGF